MRKVQINTEILFWLLCGAGAVLAFWHYGTMVSGDTN